MVSYTYCGEMPSLIGKQQSKSKWLFSCEKISRHYLGYKMERIVHHTELLGLSYQSVAENLQVDPSTVVEYSSSKSL